ncbi:D-alanyl-lipoteichoic acid biosynthesis protein DltD [Aminipila luticellarii]|uniref:D-alanyl-lipoteichoic acid biosynthesis protein DltD n=1 Tax=Aminipila luticellarii TaxID=2507160 RepID=A0A410PWV9_9FIRM|nr:D-alanyl-lipoteichoic acid biosynthesis protein DltD [Aminipila luticellarii]QAT43370.1 D-alanyl-lipoteichoic acid biosynthesis protein DltD [Aminipila luticellarii]
MSKIKAFVMALLLFSFTVYGLHIYSVQAIALDNNAFSTWPNKAKFNSPEAIRANLNKHSIVVFGSSEFEHGQKTIYHPKAMFRDFEFNPMLIGAGYYQCLEHAITLAAVGDSVETKKVVLLLSPSWFRKEGVIDTAFASRFSEGSYIEMLQNGNLSPETKRYIENRTNHLLQVDPATLKRVHIYDRVLTEDKNSLMDGVSYRVYENYLREKDRQSVILQAKLFHLESDQNKGNEDKEIDWSAYMNRAEAQGEKENQNPFYMSPKGFTRAEYKLHGRAVPEKRKVRNCYTVSPEYDDFKCFLDICRQLHIEPLVVALPVNGYYYDYTGFPADTRTKYYENIRALTKEYGVQLIDLSNEEFTKYFFEDGIHLGGKGWVTVNEALYNFYDENKKQPEM